MDIYEKDDEAHVVIDIDRARDELRRSAGIHNRDDRRAAVAEVTAAALLDIALSLRPLAAEAYAAMHGAHFVQGTVEEGPSDEERDFLVVGDLVHVEGDTEPGEVVKLGVDQAEVYADVHFASGADKRYWQRELVRLRGDKVEDDEGGESGDEPIDYGRPVHAEEVDDIDSDFDSDAHPAAESALDVLKANEAARKAAKKKGSKS
tara:strand:+ start:764 stop:1378 length:615 start_codon:yes stop_codon:yes gene_type:complete